MNVKLNNFNSSPHFKLWRSVHEQQIGFFLINSSKETLRKFAKHRFKEINVKVSAKLILQNGKEFSDVVVVYVNEFPRNYEVLLDSLNSYFRNVETVRDFDSFIKMYEYIQKLFSLSVKDLLLKAQGLFGELWFISSALDNFLASTVLSWQSEVSKTLIDFNFREGFKVEVKTYGKSGLIQYDGFHQICPDDFPSNYVTFALKVEQDESAQTLQSLYMKIINRLPDHLQLTFKERLDIASDGLFVFMSNYSFSQVDLCVFSMDEYRNSSIHNSVKIEGVFINSKQVNSQSLNWLHSEMSNSLCQ